MRFLASSVAVTLLVYVHTCCGNNYIGEGLFVVDDKAVRTYVNEIPGTDSYANKRIQAVNNLRKDLDYMLAEANQFFSTFANYGLNFEMRVKGIIVLDSDVFPSNILQNGNAIVGNSAIQIFTNWLIGQNSYATYKFDFALLLTGHDLHGDTGPYTTGLANVGRVCDPQTSVGVVEMNATYITSIVIAHEITHIIAVTTAYTIHRLGANHDGIASDKIMAVGNDPRDRHRWFYSECSVRHIQEFLPNLRNNCLLITNASSVKPTVTPATYTGQLFNHDVICRRYLGNPKSVACLSHSLYNSSAPKGDQICQQLYCSIPGTLYCSPAFPSDGMICDKNKRCNNGKCVPDSSPASANVDSNCVLGDQKILESPSFPFNGTCAQFIAERGRPMCYSDLVSQLCCATCKTHNTGLAGCAYGDQNVQCSTYPKIVSCAAQNIGICCGTCQGHTIGKRSAGERNLLVKSLTSDIQGDLGKDEGYKVKFSDLLKKVHAD